MLRQLLKDYFTLGFVAWIPAIIAGAQAIFGDSGGGGGSSSSGTPSGAHTGVADDAWQQILAQMMGGAGDQFGALKPYLSGAFTDASGAVPGMQDRMRDFAGLLTGQGRSLFGAGDELRRGGRELWDTARDPQHAMYDRNLQRTQDASRAGTSMRGIGMSPQAAGIENDAVKNFNIDWEGSQLGRMLAGSQGMAGMFDAGGRNTQAGSALLTGATGMDQAAMGMPFNLANMYSGAMSNGVYGPGSAIMGQIDPYLGLGQSGQQAAFGQNQTNMNNWTSALTSAMGPGGGGGWLANFFAPSSSGSGASSWTDPSGWGGA